MQLWKDAQPGLPHQHGLRDQAAHNPNEIRRFPKAGNTRTVGKGQDLTFPEGHADSAQLCVTPPGPSSSSSCAPWSSDSGYKQTSSHPHQ